MRKIKNKKILITGGLGFVGSNLANYFSKNNSVFVIDNKFTGDNRNKNKHTKYIFDDCKNINNISKLKKIKFDYIFHLGEYARVEQSYTDIDYVIKLNIHPIHEILKFAIKNKSKLIYSGSSTIFGKYEKKSDFSPYTWSKKTNIDYIKMFSEWYGLKYAIAYFYNVYGDNEISEGKYATVIAKFLEYKRKNKKELPITYPGTQKRNFTHIDDIVTGLEIIALNGLGDDFGIGSDQSFNIIELAKLLQMKYKIVDKKKGNRIQAKLKTNKLKKMGWRPKINLKDYIKQKTDYY